MFGKLFQNNQPKAGGMFGNAGGAGGAKQPGDKFQPTKIQFTKDNEQIRTDVCFPVTMKMIETAPLDPEQSDKLQIHGKSVSQVLMVVQLVNIDKKAIQYEITATDSTATMEMKLFYTQGDHAETIFDACKPGSWVRIIGVPRRLNGVTTVSVNLVSQVQDPFEVPFHLIESVNVAMKVTKGITSAEQEVKAEAGAAAPAQVKSERMSIDAGAGASSSSSAAAAGSGGVAADVDMDKADVKGELVKFLKLGGDAGATVADFITKFPQYTRDEADGAIADLEGDGEIFNGADDAHWAVIE